MAPLAAAALDAPAAEPAPVKIAQAAPVREAKEEAAQTLAAAAAQPERPVQPGPFHIQAGAFPDEAQAKERLQSVKEALGDDVLKAHPEFIMQVTLANGTTMYRARLGRFVSDAQAAVACKRLKKSGIECWSMPVD